MDLNHYNRRFGYILIFMSPAFEFLFGFRCVALLYVLFNIELNVEVSDTTGDAICTLAWT